MDARGFAFEEEPHLASFQRLSILLSRLLAVRNNILYNPSIQLEAQSLIVRNVIQDVYKMTDTLDLSNEELNTVTAINSEIGTIISLWSNLERLSSKVNTIVESRLNHIKSEIDTAKNASENPDDTVNNSMKQYTNQFPVSGPVTPESISSSETLLDESHDQKLEEKSQSRRTSISNSKSKFGRRKLSPEGISILSEWLEGHRDRPYPTVHEKLMLAKMTGFGISQVNDWMSNARKRNYSHVTISPELQHLLGP